MIKVFVVKTQVALRKLSSFQTKSSDEIDFV